MTTAVRPHVTFLSQSESTCEIRIVGCSGWCSGRLCVYPDGDIEATVFAKVACTEKGITQTNAEEAAFGFDRDVLAAWLTKKMGGWIWRMRVDAIVAEVSSR